MKRLVFVLCCVYIFVLAAFAQTDSLKNTVYVIDIKQEINSTSWIHVAEGFKDATDLKAKAVYIHMNTYGGMVVYADSIRTKILNSKIPVYVFIDNNAASAGALISIACDSVYMRPGANIGAATVVNQTGEKMPDKYQSYMRATIRSTAEAHGKDTVIVGNDTIIKWFRDPRIAEAMVDESIYIPGIIDTGKVLTFTAQEAMEHGYCEGIFENLKQVIKRTGNEDSEVVTFKPSFYDGLKGLLTSPVLHGILVILIIGGIYFELQSPGIGFPLAVAVLAAILYFAPLYIDGLAANWEILIFIIGLILVALEIFVIPGFGIAGISGILLIIVGLTLSMVANRNFNFEGVDISGLVRALLIVVMGMFIGLIGSVWLTKKFWGRGRLAKLALHSSENADLGYVSFDPELKKLVGKTGVATTVLRPSGRVIINDEYYDAKSEDGFIEKGSAVRVIAQESGQVYVVKAD
ncbi:nodulation protein NfeD [Saccharicrinis sp. FJH62]|uniref:NfeD family protein n=1 Tax=Saccharicrinis sp. FJH62 TaxID=3344657 RepID=UPI0035D4C41E